MLEVTDLEVCYGDYQVIWGVSLHVAEGEIVGVLGPNGAGKSTVLNAISGLRPPKAGRIEFNGESIAGLPPHEIVRRRLAHIMERRRVFPYLTVAQNLWLGGYNPSARAERGANLARVYELFPRLAERRDQLAHSLSGGEQQMLAIGRGLMASPELLLVDEPLLGLSPAMAAHTMEVLRRINASGVAILFIEQNVQTALGLADRGYVLESGRLVLDGSADELLGSDEVKRIFLGG
ncbi:MAG: ABC transporter ATP-binding protein [Gammaproteobacteria bacterium]|nr:ABC transporter ATP-binding protein [Gammaproteobacteria bacterium]